MFPRQTQENKTYLAVLTPLPSTHQGQRQRIQSGLSRPRCELSEQLPCLPTLNKESSLVILSYKKGALRTVWRWRGRAAE